MELKVNGPDHNLETDVLYISGFTPDELRRRQITEKYQKSWTYSFLRKSFLYTTRKGLLTSAKAEKLFKLYSWPNFVKPFHSSIDKAVKKFLEPKGLFIHQSYCGGVDVSYNKHFIPSVEKNFKKLGLTLLEAYHFVESPAVVLMISIKGSAKDLNMDPSAEIRSFHGRSELAKGGIKKIYSFDE